MSPFCLNPLVRDAASTARRFPTLVLRPGVSAASGGASISTLSGTGSISELVTIPPGGSVTFTVTVTGVFDDGTGRLVNTVTVGIPVGDPTPGNNGATDTDVFVGF